VGVNRRSSEFAGVIREDGSSSVAHSSTTMDPLAVASDLQSLCTVPSSSSCSTTRPVVQSLADFPNTPQGSVDRTSEEFLRSIVEDDNATVFVSSSDDSDGFRPGRQFDKLPLDTLQLKAWDLHCEFKKSEKNTVGAPAKVLEAARELARLGPEDSHNTRSERMRRLRLQAEACSAQDAAALKQLDAHVQSVLEGAGPSGSHLAFLNYALRQTKFSLVDEFLSDLKGGFPLYGVIPTGGAKARMVRRATQYPSDLEAKADELWDTCMAACRSSQQSGEQSVVESISRQTREDQALQRMGPPRAPDGRGPCPTRRFGVEQISSKGALKIRCIDDFGASGVNGCCHVIGRLRMGRVSDLVEAARLLKEKHPEAELVIFKSDFKAAYRSVAILPAHRRFADVIYWDTTLKAFAVSTQYAMPFGAVAAVYGWDRTADALVHLITTYLILPVCRYVDDLFGVCFAHQLEVVRALLIELMGMSGFSLDLEKTPLPHIQQTLLGIECRLVQSHRRRVYRCHLVATLDGAKAALWIAQLQRVIDAKWISHRDAEKLAGRLNFLTQAVAGQSGASRLSRLYHIVNAGRSNVGRGLEKDLKWWQQFLISKQSRSHVVVGPRRKAASLYTDAQGGGGIGGVLYIEDSEPRQFGIKVGSEFTGLFGQRRTFIVPLELLAVTVGLYLFRHELVGARVQFFIDNRPVLFCLRKGRCKKEDINCLVLLTVDIAASLGVCIFKWVPSNLNVADPPSRSQLLPGVETVPCKSQVVQVVRSLALLLQDS